jgi:hypothetical protein
VKKDGHGVSTDTGDDVSMMTSKAGGRPRMNSKGELHCFHWGAADHWAYECSELMGEQQGQLQMNVEAYDIGGEAQEEGHQLLNVALAQGGALLDNRAYLDRCLTVTAFKNNKYLMGVKEVHEGIKINCKAGAVVTNLRGSYGRLKVWYLPDGIANIFSMHELEQLYQITYNSWDGFYVMHTPQGEVRFHKDEQGLPFIDLDKSDKDAEILLVQLVEA